jgi:hypothetical protein
MVPIRYLHNGIPIYPMDDLGVAFMETTIGVIIRRSYTRVIHICDNFMILETSRLYNKSIGYKKIWVTQGI